MGRQRVDVRREEILTATIVEIEKRGMSSVRVTDIAQALGVSSGLVFYHFETKEALIVAALEFAVSRDAEQLDRAIAWQGEAVERLRHVLASYGPTGAAHGWTLWIEAWSTALRVPSVRTSLRRLDRNWCRALEYVITDGIGTGQFVCSDPHAAVVRIGALLDGLSVASLVYRSISRSQLRTWIRDATADELGISRALLA